MADFNLPNLLDGINTPEPDSFAWAEVAARTGFNQARQSQAERKVQELVIPMTIYDTQPSERLEAASAQIINNPDTFRALSHKALGAGVSIMTYARQMIAHALTHSKIDFFSMLSDDKGNLVVPADKKRKKDEDNKDNPPQILQILKAYLREPSFTQLNLQAKSLGVSTHALFVMALDEICDTPNTIALLKDSDEAMKLLHESKKKANIINDFLQQV